MSIIGLSSSCGGGDKVSQSKSQNRRHQPPKPSICSHLRLLDGHEEAAYLPQDGDGQPARAQLAGAEQHQRQPLHGVQDGGVRAALGRYLESRAGLQQLRRARIKEKNKASVSSDINNFKFSGSPKVLQPLVKDSAVKQEFKCRK